MSTSAGQVDVIVCGECGSANDVGVSFCGACGAYLEWEGERLVPATPSPPPTEQVELEPEKLSLLDRVKAGLGMETEGQATARGSTPDADERAPGGETVPAGSSPSVHPPGEASTGRTDPLTTTKAPVSPTSAATSPAAPSTTPSTGQPVARKPAAEAAPGRKRTAVVTEQRPQPGETVCGQCGAGNAPARKFCRRCGNDLADAVVVPPLPWWRRLVRRRNPASTPAGTRPKVRKRSRTLQRLVIAGVLVAALVLAGRLAWPWVSMPIDAVRDRLAGSEPVNPVAVSASSSAPGHGAALTKDRATYTYWSPAGTGSGAQQYVQHTFSDPFRLVALQIYNGSSQNPKQYLKTARLRTVLVTFGRSDGSLQTQSITLKDEPGLQDFSFGVNDVTSLRLTVQSAYDATARTRIALAEVVALKRS